MRTPSRRRTSRSFAQPTSRAWSASGRLRGPGGDRPRRHGRGAQGADPVLNRVVAVKVLSPYLACSATARRRFVREAQAAAAVCHDHIVTIHSVHEADGLPYLVMQYVAGESLQDRLSRCGPLEVMEVVRIGLQTASGLAAAHAQGLIHRDIKPGNLLLEDPSPPTPLPRSGEREGMARQDHRLWACPHDRRRAVDAERSRGRHPGIHGPGASAGRDDRSPRRPVQPWQRDVCHVYGVPALPRFHPFVGASSG